MNSNIIVFDKKPNDFFPKVEVAAIYVNVKDKILLMQLADHKSENGSWGVPAGKLEAQETPLHAAKRELFEETGINIESDDAFQSLGALYIRKPELDYVYHLFGISFDAMPTLFLSDEHCSHVWVSRKETEALPLMNGAKQALDTYYQASKKRVRTGTSVNVYLILRNGDEVLLHLRKATGYCDGFYGLVSGHVEDGEQATAAIIREAYEEAGIQIEPSGLKVVHVMHRQTNRFNMDLFFECSEWKGAITNQEPEKCSILAFFPLTELPPNTIGYIKDALEAIIIKRFYSERGWA